MPVKKLLTIEYSWGIKPMATSEKRLFTTKADQALDCSCNFNYTKGRLNAYDGAGRRQKLKSGWGGDGGRAGRSAAVTEREDNACEKTAYH